MIYETVRHLFIHIVLLAALSGCPSAANTAPSSALTESTTPRLSSPSAIEVEVTPIPLSGPIADDSAEISGLAWFDDHLILLPQYRVAADFDQHPIVYAIPREQLQSHIDGENTQPIVPGTIDVVAPGLFDRIPGSEGFEAIAFSGTTAFATIEARHEGQMSGYLVKGEIAMDLSRLTIDTDTITQIPMSSTVANASDESVVVIGQRVMTLYEANGPRVNSSPSARLFDMSLQPVDTIPFPPLEYRVTDVTDIDEQGRFWAINYMFCDPDMADINDVEAYRYSDEPDAIAKKYGQGTSHRKPTRKSVERLLLFEYTETGISLIDRAPVQLQLINRARNWEGLARLDDRRLLLVTDMHPDTILAYVSVSP